MKSFMKRKCVIISILTISLFLLLLSCSPRPRQTMIDPANTVFVLWDMRGALANQGELLDHWKQHFPNHYYLTASAAEEHTIDQLSSIMKGIRADENFWLMVISDAPQTHRTLEWNIWMPSLWRSLKSNKNILTVDVPGAEEFLDPLKYQKNSIWVVHGLLGHLKPKLEGSYITGSCLYNEANLTTRLIDENTKMPLYGYYFLSNLLEALDRMDSTNSSLTTIHERTVEQTHSAMVNLVTDIEKIQFFQQTGAQPEEFRRFPNPFLWNGLAKQIYFGEEE